jgi:hypothetical protein
MLVTCGRPWRGAWKGLAAAEAAPDGAAGPSAFLAALCACAGNHLTICFEPRCVVTVTSMLQRPVQCENIQRLPAAALWVQVQPCRLLLAVVQPQAGLWPVLWGEPLRLREQQPGAQHRPRVPVRCVLPTLSTSGAAFASAYRQEAALTLKESWHLLQEQCCHGCWRRQPQLAPLMQHHQGMPAPQLLPLCPSSKVWTAAACGWHDLRNCSVTTLLT